MLRPIALVLACLATGCLSDVDVLTPPQRVPDDGFGVVVQPRLGAVVEGSTATTSVAFAGVHAQPGYRIDLQVLERAGTDTRWVTIASATTDTQPSSTDATMYEWNVIAAPALLVPSRWPQGGLLHVRAVGEGGEQLAGLFHDADACLASLQSWRERATACGGVFPSGIVVASPGDVADATGRPRFLDRRGAITTTETDTYYQTINAPATLADFTARFGITASSPQATYYNAGDLGIGREMHCQPQAGGGLACASSNYGQFGGLAGDALDAAIRGTEGGGGAFATVTMVYTPPITAPNSVQFMVYGAAGALANHAQLDTVGDNVSIPNNCINCHGSSASYDPIAHQVTGARFLPFDPGAFAFSPRAGYTAADQRPNLTALDGLVRSAAPTPAIQETIDGVSSSASTFVPHAWSTTPLEQHVYKFVIADHCRTCHASRTDDLSFQTAEMFTKNQASIAQSLCVSHDMPNAQVPLQRMWAGPARAYLAAYFDWQACDP